MERAPGERDAFLRQACDGDEPLRQEVESLLGDGLASARFLERPAVEASAGLVGRQLGPYQILAPLGAGGMGEVYRARDTRLERDVAIKVLPKGFAADPDRLRRFEQEARAIAALNHPNICQIYDIGPGYLVLEYVEGESLHGAMAVERRSTHGAAHCERARGGAPTRHPAP